MCFSAEASFTAAALLGTIGATTIKNSQSRSQFFLATIPLLFAIQQLAEGFLWIQLNNPLGADRSTDHAKKVFLTFAFLIWPVWVPLALACVEKIAWRRFLIILNLACGIALSLFNFSYALKQEAAVRIVDHSLQYMGHVPSQSILYPLIILLPCFISSYKSMWLFGIFVAVGYFIAEHYYATTFVSVWCFFAALVSLLIYKVIRDNQLDFEKTSTD